MLIWMINFIRGVVRVQLMGAHCEQIINILHRKNVNFWKMRRINEQSVEFTIYEKHLSTVKQVCSLFHAEWKINQVSSVRAVLLRYKKRWGIVLGLLLSVMILGIFSCFIWDVQISGCAEKMTVADVKAQFEKMGIGVGALRYGKDLSAIENQFLLANDEVMWVSINMHHTTAHIQLREKNGQQTKIHNYDNPCDIYASRDGQIISMIVTNGVPMVREGDSVVAGDLLVSHEYIDRYGETILVHSIAIIKAKTQRKIEVKVPLNEEIHTATGRNKSFLTLNLFNFKIPLYFKKNIIYNNYDLTESYSCVKIGKNFALPISLDKKTYTEVTVQTVAVDRQKAKILAMNELEHREKDQLSQAEIQNRNIKESVVNGYLVLTAEYQCLEDIGYTLEIT